MLVILRENVENLGKVGDVVKTTDGYARNYLLPRNLVMVADGNNLAQLEHFKKGLEKKRKALVKSAEELAQKLSEFSCTLSRKVGEKDKIFGSVTPHDIAHALSSAGFAVTKTMIQVDHPIKTLGVHTVTVKLDTEVKTSLKVWVVKEE